MKAQPPPSSWKLYAVLICFGLLLGLGGGVLALKFLAQRSSGKEFDTVDDLRRAMLSSAPHGESAAGVPLLSIINPHPDNKIIFDLRPGLHVKFQKVTVETNSCGMRDREYPVKKAPGTYRIALLGDSFAFGWGVEQETIFPEVLEAQLNQLAPRGMKVEVLNFGVPGYSTFQEVEKFRETGLEFDPDAVLVYFVQNDFDYPFFVHDMSGGGGLLSSARFLNLSKRDPKAESEKMRLAKLDPDTALRSLADLGRAQQFRVAVAFNSYPGWEKQLRRLPVFRERDDIAIVPLREPLLQIIKERGIDLKDLNLSDDPHPSALKHVILGEILAAYFLGLPEFRG